MAMVMTLTPRVVFVTAVLVGAVASTALSPTAAHANLIQDPTFNVAPPNAGQQYYQNYSTTFDGVWQILDNNVDVVAPGLTTYGMTPPGGPLTCCSVDLVGTGSTGGIFQAITVPVSGFYTLTFDFANNFYSTNTASAIVEVGTTGGGSSDLLPAQTVTHNTSTGPTAVGMDWRGSSDVFFANAGLLYLTFDTTFGQSNGGVVITDLDLTDATNANATPLPATWTVMLIGLVGLGFIACRRQRLGVSFEAA
jgi:hypothetical protein